jgi:hypothetical protein
MPSVFAVTPVFCAVCTTVPLIDEVDLIGAHPYFQRIDGLAGIVRLFHGIVGSSPHHISGSRVAVAILDQPRAVLRYLEVQVLLLGSFKIAAAEYEAVIVRDGRSVSSG